MLKKIAFAGVGFALLATPIISSADTLTDLQTQIAGLLNQLKQLQSQLTQQQGANTTTNSGGGVGIAVPASLYPVDPISICPAFRRVLMYGVSGDDVVELQKFLVSQGLLSSDSATGFFGRMTEVAVQKLQAQNGIVSSGDSATTGWGAIGPTTRAWIARWCAGRGNNPNFTASPTSGQAPLAVTFAASHLNGGQAYSIDFGDGSQSTLNVICANDEGPCPSGRDYAQTTHTYTGNGTYVARLIYQPAWCPGGGANGVACTAVMPVPRTIGTVMIRVGNSPIVCPVVVRTACPAGEHYESAGPDIVDSNGCRTANLKCVPNAAGSGAPSISGIDGPASLNVGQQGTWTVHASVASSGSTNLRYSVIWGDEGVVDQLNVFAGNTSQAIQMSGSFTHAYARVGTFRPTFTVANDAGSAQTSASVVVRSNGDEEGGGGGGGGGNDTFSASPTSGTAPLTVIFRSNIVNDLGAYSISFGDGTNGTLQNNCQLGYGACGLPTASHTYTVNGTFAAQLIKSSAGGCPANVSDSSCLGAPASRQVVGTVTITVGGSTSSGTFTATPKTGAPPLMVTFTGVGNYISFGDDGPTLVASGNGSLGTVTHVYRGGGEYTATSDERSVNISVTPDRLADWRSTFGGGGASAKLCVYNNRTYQSGTSVDVPMKTCTRGALFSGPMCDRLAMAGGQTNITSQRYSCSNGQWYDPNNIPVEGELVNATSCLASDGVTTVGNGQLIAQGAGAIGFDWYSTYGHRPMTMTMKCDKGTWLSCDASGNNCMQTSTGENANLANALAALESALKALIIKLGQ